MSLHVVGGAAGVGSNFSAFHLVGGTGGAVALGLGFWWKWNLDGIYRF